MKTHQRNGFTLIELIVVIAILAILALLIVPQLTGYTTAAQKTVCQSNMQTTIRQYFYDKTGIDSATAEKNLKTSTASGKICPSGGKITYTIDGDTVTLVCSKHGSVSAEESQFANSVINSIALGKVSRLLGNNSNQDLATYFGVTIASPDKSIDSGAKETTTDSGKTILTMTKAIQNAIGTTFSGYWTLRKQNNNYVLYVADTALTLKNVGSSVSVTKYTFASTGNVLSTERVTANVTKARNNDYVTLNQ